MGQGQPGRFAKKERESVQRRTGNEWVAIGISWVSNNRREKERRRAVESDNDAIVLYGSNSDSKALASLLEDRFKLGVEGVEMVDSRARYLVVLRMMSKYWAIPAPEPFSRHCGICVVVGDRKTRSLPVKLELGCCLRLGSVGLVVSEICGRDGELHTLSQEHIQYLKEGADIWHGDDEDEAKLAQDDATCFEDDLSNCENDSTSSERAERLCYMCYDTVDTPENPLVAPCDCRGDTRFVHMQCLQKWYNSTTTNKAHVVRISATGTTACKVCGAPYKTTVRLADGRKTHLLESAPGGPYVSLIVVTRHDTSPTLFSTKFRLSFGRREDFTHEEINSLTIGRSSACDVVLDYRTVSTTHARVYLQGDDIHLVDLSSSNGTMMYIRSPLELPYGRQTKLRVGRSTVSITPRRTWRGRLSSSNKAHTNETAEQVMEALADIAHPVRRPHLVSLPEVSPMRTAPASPEPTTFFVQEGEDLEDEKEEISSPATPITPRAQAGDNETI